MEETMKFFYIVFFFEMNFLEKELVWSAILVYLFLLLIVKLKIVNRFLFCCYFIDVIWKIEYVFTQIIGSLVVLLAVAAVVVLAVMVDLHSVMNL